MRSFTPARPIKRRAFDVRKKRDQSRVSDAEIIVILQQWLGALRAGGGKDIDGSLRRICASHAARQNLRHPNPLHQKKAAMKIAAVYEAVTRSIIAELKQGAAPWVKPWKGGSSIGIMPPNAITGRCYSGINIPILWHAAEVRGYPTNAWLTFKQAREKGACVRKGEKGTQVVFTKRLSVKKDDDADEERQISMPRAFTVFNVAQVDGFDAPHAVAAPAPPAGAVDAFAAATSADICRGGDKALFIPSMDLVVLPAAESFESAEHYRATKLINNFVVMPGYARVDGALFVKLSETASGPAQHRKSIRGALLCIRAQQQQHHPRCAALGLCDTECAVLAFPTIREHRVEKPARRAESEAEGALAKHPKTNAPPLHPRSGRSLPSAPRQRERKRWGRAH